MAARMRELESQFEQKACQLRAAFVAEVAALYAGVTFRSAASARRDVTGLLRPSRHTVTC
jgi:hypothetical protein